MRPELPLNVVLPPEAARLVAKLNAALDAAQSGEFGRALGLDGFRTGILLAVVVAVVYILFRLRSTKP